MKKTVKLYVNDPMGGRCETNLKSARKLGETLDFDLVVIKKTSAEYAAEKNPPPCPSVAVDDRFVVTDGVASLEQMREALEQD